MQTWSPAHVGAESIARAEALHRLQALQGQQHLGCLAPRARIGLPSRGRCTKRSHPPLVCANEAGRHGQLPSSTASLSSDAQASLRAVLPLGDAKRQDDNRNPQMRTCSRQHCALTQWLACHARGGHSQENIELGVRQGGTTRASAEFQLVRELPCTAHKCVPVGCSGAQPVS